jgi:hypothetical protein
MSSYPIRSSSTGASIGETAPMMRALIKYNIENPGKLSEQDLNIARDNLNYRLYPHYMTINQYVNPNTIHKTINFAKARLNEKVPE